jgi:hypothetical protein
MTPARLRQALATHGRRRAKARERAATETAEIARLAPLALSAGIPKIEVAKLAQISRTALDALLDEHS